MARVDFAGGLPTDLTPAHKQSLLTSNYIDFNSIEGGAFSQQFLPELYEAEVEKYGNRTVGSFLRLVGAEMPMQSDQVIWSEQGRLHLSYAGATINAAGQISDIAGTDAAHAVRVGQTVLVKGAGYTSPIRCYVSVADGAAGTLTVIPYDASSGNTFGTVTGKGTFSAAATVSFFVYGSEFAKGTLGMDGSITPEVETFTNKPIILKDKFEVSGSDTAQIGWIEVSGEAGQSGYLWYMKAEGDTRTRFEDYLEMSLVEAVSTTNATLAASKISGTEGLFSALENRGIVADGAFDDAADLITDFDLILKELDKQGSIEENMLFLGRNASLTIDSALAAQNSYGTGGTSYGVFENSEDMALNLGFSGFRRGSYDFYKTDWKYLNSAATRGGFDDIEGVLVPAGTTSVYDQMMGKNIRRPFLHVRYRASETDDRKMKSWVVGSVGGASNSEKDAMEINYLSERCLVTQAANNFVLFKK
jgi:hypothetical protein